MTLLKTFKKVVHHCHHSFSFNYLSTREELFPYSMWSAHCKCEVNVYSCIYFIVILVINCELVHKLLFCSPCLV